jgi:uncharacterized spore protein YtfJ
MRKRRGDTYVSAERPVGEDEKMKEPYAGGTTCGGANLEPPAVVLILEDGSI